MVGPVPLNPFRRTIIVDAGDRYYQGTFTWFPTRVSFDERPTPKNDDLPAVDSARRNERIQSILVWSRFPVWQVREAPEGVEVSLRDMRFRGVDRGGFSTTVFIPR